MKLIHVVCFHCDAINRIPTVRLPDNPRCGQCKQSLFAHQSVALRGSNFDRHVGNSDIPVVVDFWAPWCNPCNTMAPAFEQATTQLEPHVRLTKVNTEVEQALAGRFNIRSLPTLVIFRNGGEIARQLGVMTAQDIVNWVQSRI